MKNKFLFIQFTMIVLLLTLIISCKKDDITLPETNPASEDDGVSSIIFNAAKTYGTMTDQNGYVYKTITIGTQTWMAENLRVTKYRNGDAIPKVTDNAAWGVLNTGAFCNYANSTGKDGIATYGRLYNWFAIADSRNIAPTGWHVPTDAEWTTLITYLGGESVSAGKLREAGYTHWVISIGTTIATNESGFTAMPAGIRDHNDGSFSWLCGKASYWSATANGTSNAWLSLIYYNSPNCSNSSGSKQDGYSVRLVKD